MNYTCIEIDEDGNGTGREVHALNCTGPTEAAELAAENLDNEDAPNVAESRDFIVRADDGAESCWRVNSEMVKVYLAERLPA